MSTLHASSPLAAPIEERAVRDGRSAWRPATSYLRRGLALVGVQPSSYLRASLVYMLPALAAAGLLVAPVPPGPPALLAAEGLPWVTAVLGTLVVMVLVGHHAHGRVIRLAPASLIAGTWVPRYLWTNAHTTIIFWVPVGLLLAARAGQESVWPVTGGASLAVAGLWWLMTAAAALYLHTRTLLAPFLAVHSDLPATLAVLEAWRLSGRSLGLCLSTLLVAGLPVALPLALLTLAVVLLAPGGPVLLDAAGSALIWAAIQALRPVLMPAVFLLYQDLWAAEQARRAAEGEPPTPDVARRLLGLTRSLPRCGRPW